MNRKFANGLFIFILALGFFLSLFRGFGFAEKSNLTVPTDAILDASSVKEVYKIMHHGVNKDTGDIKESVSRYQHLVVKNNDFKKDIVVVELCFENSAKSDVVYDFSKVKLVLENGERISVTEDFSALFDDEFKPGYTQIGNLAFNTKSEDLKCIEFPDGSICGL